VSVQYCSCVWSKVLIQFIRRGKCSKRSGDLRRCVSIKSSARGWPNRTAESKGPTLRRSRERRLTVMLIPPCGRSMSPCCLSAEKSRARFCAPLRCAQNDSMADECMDVTLTSATLPVRISGVVSVGFSFSPESLPEADSMSLDKWGRIG